MEKLLRLNTVSDSSGTTKLRALYDQIKTSIRSLEVLRIKLEQFGSLLVAVILMKITLSSTNISGDRALDFKVSSKTWRI